MRKKDVLNFGNTWAASVCLHGITHHSLVALHVI